VVTYFKDIQFIFILSQLLFKLPMIVRYFVILILTFSSVHAQQSYFQQHVEYRMFIDFDVDKHRFRGKQVLEFDNNSQDTLHNIYYHLYYNAFQPGSMMDVRSRSVQDPDRRIGDSISKLNENQIGYHKIISLIQNYKNVEFEINGTILMVKLNEAIPPGVRHKFTMEFESQVPVHIRRTGRNNIEGIDYSMAQWYPKLCVYDYEGWHTTQYVAREYYGEWGNYEVEISIDSSYTLASSGRLLNMDEIGRGYGKKVKSNKNLKWTWKFRSDAVHDFVWTADRNYIHTTAKTNNGITIHFFYQNDSNIIENWEKLPTYTVSCFEYMNELVGDFLYDNYSVIQGGDGGMEYPMASLILGNGKMNGLISVMIHETIHGWFQGALANNEGKYPWMDEGFNTYFNHIVKDSLLKKKNILMHKGSYDSYLKWVKSESFEAISMHSDHYKTNRAYGTAAYSAGCVFLNQLEYIIGKEAFENTIHQYYNTWKLKHPGANDFKRVAEKESGMDLDWYFNYFIHTTRTIDYAVDTIIKLSKDSTEIRLSNQGDFPMPVDVKIKLKDTSVHLYNIPLRMMLYGKEKDGVNEFKVLDYWQWTNETYSFKVPFRIKDISTVSIDPTLRLADTDRKNNRFSLQRNKKKAKRKAKKKSRENLKK